MIYAILKMLHLLALVFGAAASLGNIYLLLARGPHDLPAPALANALRKWYRLTALGAILLLWATGLVMLPMRHGFRVEGFALNAKIALAGLLLAIVFYLNWKAPVWARRGGPPAYLPALHLTGAASLILAVIFAVAAFA
ncbi:MAG: hypothetical protein BroJett030_27670 [Alphaproteobacteria bacterium]|nr:MAG: hypothetical protein BroJett030_27670 [Alphaproteobacteria bacterium]